MASFLENKCFLKHFDCFFCLFLLCLLVYNFLILVLLLFKYKKHAPVYPSCDVDLMPCEHPRLEEVVHTVHREEAREGGGEGAGDSHY